MPTCPAIYFLNTVIAVLFFDADALWASIRGWKQGTRGECPRSLFSKIPLTSWRCMHTLSNFGTGLHSASSSKTYSMQQVRTPTLRTLYLADVNFSIYRGTHVANSDRSKILCNLLVPASHLAFIVESRFHPDTLPDLPDFINDERIKYVFAFLAVHFINKRLGPHAHRTNRIFWSDYVN